MTIELNDDNFMVFAIKHYSNPGCVGMSELEDDLNYFKQAIALRKDTHKMYREMDDLPPGMAPSAKVYREMDDKDNV